ncbi:MAG: phage tail tape measure protein [Planctomycetota bacterium]
MTEQLPGLELFLSSEKAVEGANKFRTAVESAAAAVERIGMTVDALQKLLDKLGPAAQKTAPPVKKVGDEAGEAGKKMKGAAQGTDDFRARLGLLGSIASKVGLNFGTLTASIGGFLALRSAVGVIKDTEDKLRILESVTGATAGQMEKLAAAANTLAINSRFSFGDATGTLIGLAKAGATAQQAVAALPSVSNLARAGLLSLGQAGDTVINTMAQFGLTIEASGRIGDVLVKAADSTTASVDSLADALVRVGPAGKELGISLETVTAALATLQQAGVPARVAGTGLAEIFKRLADPVNGPEGAAQAIRDLNLSLNDVSPRNFTKALDELAKAGLTLQDATALVGTEFDLLLTTLVRGRESVKALESSLQSAGGDAAKKAAATVGTLGDSLDRLSNAKDRFFREGGKAGLSAALSEIARTGTDALNVLSGDAEAMKGAGAAGQILAGSVKVATSAIAGLVTFAALQRVAALSTGMYGAGKAVGALTLAIRTNPVGALVSALAVAGTAFSLFGSSVQDSSAKLDAFRKAAGEAEATAERFEQLRLAILQGAAGSAEAFTKAIQAQLIALNDAVTKSGTRSFPALEILSALEAEAPQAVARAKQLFQDLKTAFEKGEAGTTAAFELRIEAMKKELRSLFGVELKEVLQNVPGGIFDQQKLLIAGFSIESANAIEAVSKALVKATGNANAAREALAGAAAASKSLQRGGSAKDNPEKERADALSRLIQDKAREVELAGLATEQAKKAKFFEDLTNAAFTARRGLRLQEFFDLVKIGNQLNANAKAAADEKRAETAKKILESLREENALLGEQGAAREALKKEQEVLGALAAAKVSTTSAEYQEAQSLLATYRDLVKAEEDLAKAKQDQKREDRLDRRSDDAFRQLKQEEDGLRLVGAEREKYRREIEAENDARQAGLKVGSAEYQDFVRRKVAAAEFADNAQRIGGAFQQVGSAAGSALERLIIDMENGRDVAKAFFQDLQRIAVQQFVTKPLAQFIAEAASSAFVGTAAKGGGGETVGTTGWFAASVKPQLTGGLIPAMTGTVVDDYGTLQRGGKSYSFAEGGGTTPEAIFPLQRDAQGRLGLVAADGGGQTTINMSFPGVRNGRDARDVRATAGQQLRQALDSDLRGRRGLRPRVT